MKKFITGTMLLSLLGIISQAHGQWTKEIVDSYLNRGAFVEVADLDNDGDLDAVATAFSGDDLIWYENDGGYPNSWIERTIDGNLNGPVGICITDVDNNDTLDIIVAVNSTNLVYWYKNMGGSPLIWWRNLIGSLSSAEVPYAADFDNDGDQDVAVTGVNSNSVVWFENRLPLLWTMHTIDAELEGAMSLVTVDMDADEDYDIAVAARDAGDVVWYENRLPLTWNKHSIDNNLPGAWTVRIADMDGDDTLDAVATGYYANDIAWYKNTNNGQNWIKETIDANLGGAFTLYIGDINLDETMDIVVTGRTADKIICYQNNLPNPWTKDTIDANIDGPNYVCLADIDNDTDLDVFATGWDANNVVLYRNPAIPIVDVIKPHSELVPNTYSLSQNYPNPFNPSTKINYHLTMGSYVDLSVYNILGQKVATLISKKQMAGTYNVKWNASNLASGVYFYRLQAGDYVKTKKMVLMK